MKIRPDMYEILQLQDQNTKVKPKGAEGTASFDSMLLQAQASLPDGKAISAEAALTTAMNSGSMIDPSALVATLEGQNSDTENDDATLFSTITEQANNLLGSIDQYAKELASGTAPRQMWDMLNGMNGQIAGMRNNLGAMSTPHEGLASLLNDMEVLTATESFKMNRGDYQ